MAPGYSNSGDTVPAHQNPRPLFSSPLPAVESLQVSGEAFPGKLLQASGFSTNGTTTCHFWWLRCSEDGSVDYIEGANEPTYLVTVHDVDSYLAVEVQPMDNRGRKGETVRAFANEQQKITYGFDRNFSVLVDPKILASGRRDDPLPAIESLQVSGEAFPGKLLQASGFSTNGTTTCHFWWLRCSEDGSVDYIEGANEPTYLVTAHDVDSYLAVEVQPMDNIGRKGETVRAFANEQRKITYDLGESVDPEILAVSSQIVHGIGWKKAVSSL